MLERAHEHNQRQRAVQLREFDDCDLDPSYEPTAQKKVLAWGPM